MRGYPTLPAPPGLRAGALTEDVLSTFDEWLKFQGIDGATLTQDELSDWREMFDEGRSVSLATPKLGLMKLKRVPGVHLYAVAVRENSDLWLTLWVRASPTKYFGVFMPRGDGGWDIHASYHRDGTFHQKGFGHKSVAPKKLQPLTGPFRGTEHLGGYMGHFPKSVGAICDPNDFSGVVDVAPGVLGGSHGSVSVDLIEPGCEPIWCLNVVQEVVFKDIVPWVVIRISS